MLSEKELAAMRARHGMNDDSHEKLIASVQAEVERHGIKGPAVKAAVGAILGAGRVKLDAAGEVEWTGDEGWDMQTGIRGFLAASEHKWLRDASQPSRAKDAVPSKGDLRKHVENAVAAAFMSPTMSDTSREAIGRALAEHL